MTKYFLAIVTGIMATMSQSVAGQGTSMLSRLIRDVTKDDDRTNSTNMSVRDRYDQDTDIGRAIQMGTIVLICAFLPPLLIYCLTMKARKLLYRSQLLSKKIFEEKLKIAVDSSHQSILKAAAVGAGGVDHSRSVEKTSRL